MRRWKRDRLEHTRESFDELRARLGSAYELWVELMQVVRPAVGAALLGDQLNPQAPANYLSLRDEWMRRWHGFCQDVESLYLDSEDVPSGFLSAIERCWYYPSLRESVTSIREYGRDEKIESATFIPATDFWERLNGRIDDVDRVLPSRRRERVNQVLGWLRSRPDWIEAHPRTIWLGIWVVFGILAWQAPEILKAMTEFVKALRGG